MKRFFSVFAVAALSLAAIVSCKKEEAATVIDLTGIELTQSSLNLLVGNSATLEVTYTPSNATSKPAPVWTSSDADVATVSKGVVTAVAPGNATITAKVGKLSKSCEVTVTAVEVPATDIQFAKSELVLLVGQQQAIEYSIVPANSTDQASFASSDEKIATVTAAGLVTAVAEGQATITVTAGKIKKPVKVTVEKVVIPVTAIELSQSEVTLKPGETATVTATLKPEGATGELLWGTSDATIATVEEGVITAVAEGTATITASVGEVQARVAVTVKEEVVPPTPVEFDPENFAAIDWSNKNAAAWYKFAEDYLLADGFTFTIHIYPYTLNTVGMRVGNFGKRDESPCNMLRFGQNGNNAELEWMVDYKGGRSQRELLAPGFKENTWHAVTLTADKATGAYKIYRDGELQAEKTFTYNDAMGFGAIEFANSWGSSYRSAFNGRIALVSVYNKALTADEIKENIFDLPVSDACVGLWTMSEGEGGLLKADQSKAIKEDIDLTKATRTDNESDYIIVDVTPYITWTTGNSFASGDVPGPGPDEPQLVEGTVPNMNQKMFGVTFPDEFASLDATTFEGWVNAVNYNGAQANLPTFMGTENAFLVRFDGGRPEIVLGDPVTGGGEIKASSKTAMSTGEWHHIAAVYTRNAKVALYVDGKKVAENNTNDYPVTYNSGVKPGTNDDAKIGRKFWVGNAYSTRWFNGSMSHLRVWSKALTNDEIVASANNRALETAEGLIANWPLTEDKGLAITDLSGNALNTEYKSASDAAGVIETTEPERTTGVELPTLEAPVHPTSIKITAEETLVKTGLTIQLSATVLPENAWDKSVSWRSENEEVATVDQNGLVKGVTPGTVKIYAENTAENLSDNVTITVEARYTPGTVSPDFSANMNSLVIDWGSTDVSSLNDVTVEWKMKAKAWTNSYQYQSWYWTYTGTTKVNSVFGVDGQWLLRIGDANIPENQLEVAGTGSTNRLDYDFQAGSWYHVAVVYSVTSGTTKYYVNGNLKGTVEGVTVPANFTGARISESWKDNNVNSRFFNGYLADLRVWKTARTAEQIFAGLNAFDDNSNEDLLLNLKLDNGNQVFVNSANTDATVQPTQEFEWIEERPEIQELVEATEVKIDTPASTEIKVTETLQLSAQVLPENAENRLITWSSDNTAVATVDQNGLVKGVGLGEVNITATNEKSGLYDSVTLTVVRKYEPGTVTPDFSVNYNSVSINWGTANVSSLGKLTVEWKMNAHDFFNEYYYGNNVRGTSVVNSVFGVEGKWLLRIGDLGIDNNQLELADHNHPRLAYDFKADTWYHVAVTYDTESGKTEFYVNGELKGSFEGTATSAADLRGAFIGQSYKDNGVNSRYFNGYLADVRVWNTIRSAEQIKSGINEFTDQASENLLLYLKLDEGLAALENSATASDATASFTADAGWSVLRPVIDVADGGATGTLPDFDPVTGFQW